MISKEEAIAMAKDAGVRMWPENLSGLLPVEAHDLVNAAYAKGLEDAAVFAIGDLIGERHSQVGERIAHGIRLMKEQQ